MKTKTIASPSRPGALAAARRLRAEAGAAGAGQPKGFSGSRPGASSRSTTASA